MKITKISVYIWEQNIFMQPDNNTIFLQYLHFFLSL